MSYSVSTRYTSPYRPGGTTTIRKDYVSTTRRGSAYERVDQREGGSSPRRYGGDRTYSNIADGDATVATNVLNGMIDNALRSPTPINYTADPSLRNPRDFTVDSQLRSHESAKPYYRPRDHSRPRSMRYNDTYSQRSTTSPVRSTTSPVRSSNYSRSTTNTYRVRDQSPRYQTDRDPYSSHRDQGRVDGRAYESSRKEYDVGGDSRAGQSYSGGRSQYGENRFSNSVGRGGYEERGSPYEREYNSSRSNAVKAYEPLGHSTPSRGDFRNSTGRAEYERGSMRSDFDRRENEYNHYNDRRYDDRNRTEQRSFDHRENRDRRESSSSYDPREDRDRRESNRIPGGNFNDINERNIYSQQRSSNVEARNVETFSQMPPRSPNVLPRGESGVPQYTFHNSPREIQVAQSDLSSTTGAMNITFPDPMATSTPIQNSSRGVSTRSVFTTTSVASAWHNDDVVLLPKDQKVSQVAVAATAAASLILDEKSVCGFDTAARSVCNLVQPGNRTENIDAVIEPSILGRADEEHSHVPISYTSVQEGMKRNLMLTASVPNAKEEKMGSLPMDAYQFWARCTLLTATAILKTGGYGSTQLAHVAAETVMMHGIASMHQEWLNTADADLKNVADAVNETVRNSPGGNEDVASAASIALLTDGTKALAMERVRRSVPSRSHHPSTVVEVVSDEGSDNSSQDQRKFQNIPNRPVEEKSKSRSLESPPPSNSPSAESSRKREGAVDINRIRSSGSLLDIESSDDEKSGPINAPSPQAVESYNNFKKDYLADTVNKLLSAPTEDKPVVPVKVEPPTRTSPKLRHQELEHRREEIAQRIQRIQQRAAAERDMPLALDHISVNPTESKGTKKASSVSGVGGGLSSMASRTNNPSSASVATKTSRASTTSPASLKSQRGHSKPPINNMSTATLGNKLPPTHKATKKTRAADSGSSVFNPLMQFIEKISCSMDMGDSDSGSDSDGGEIDNKENQSDVSSLDPERDAKAFQEKVQRLHGSEAFDLKEISKPNLEIIGNNSKEENWETLDSLDSTDKHSDVIQGNRSVTTEGSSLSFEQDSRMRYAISSHDSGAFSAAFSERNLSDIPIKRLSLTPSSQLVSTLQLETNQHLFFDNENSNEPATQAPPPSASDAYVNMAERRARGAQTATVKVPGKKHAFKNRFSRR